MRLTFLGSRVCSLTDSANDVLIGVGNGDEFTGTTATDDAGDIIVDGVQGDGDTFTLTSADNAPALTTVNVENIVINQDNLASRTVDAANFRGAEQLTVTRGDVTVGGSTLTGNKAVAISNVSSDGVAQITVGAGTTAVDIDAAATDLAGIVLNADTATGAVTVDGAATINAALATRVDIDAVSNTTAAETAKASVINAAAATTVTTHTLLTGSIEINAAAATTVTVDDAQGGATVDAQAAGATITVADIDDSGATITAGTGTADTALTINIDDIAASSATSTATINAAGIITLDIDGAGAGVVEAVILGGNGAAVTYNIATPAAAATSITKTGDQTVTVAGNEDVFAGVTVTNIDILDLNAGSAATIDGDSWTVGAIDLGFDNQGNAITLADAATLELTSDQAGLDIDFATGGSNLTIVAGDDNGTSTAVGTVTVGALDVASATLAGTVTIEASIGNFTAAGVTLDTLQSLVVTGDEDVTLSTAAGNTSVIAASVDASASSGILTVNVEDTTANVADVASVTGGSGNDVIVVDVDGGLSTGVVTVLGNAGNDQITVESASASSLFNGGAGNDTFTITDTTAVVVVGEAGTDTFQTGTDIEALIVGGDDTDTFLITGGTLDFSDNTSFSLSSIEVVNLTAAAGTTTISSAQLANNPTFSVVADGDQLTVDIITTGGTLDASGITVATDSTAILNYLGSTGADTFTGGVANEQFTNDQGVDAFEGGDGTDTLVSQTNVTETGSANPSTGAVINLSSASISAATVASNVAGFISASSLEVAAGTAQNIYAASLTGNAATVDTISGIENVTGTADIDYIVGDANDNVLIGGAGADYISGGQGDDVITGGDGIDALVGGDGADTFDFSTIVAAADANNISDFDADAGGAAVDVLRFDAVTFTAYTAGTAVAIGDVANNLIDANTVLVDIVANVITNAVDTTQAAGTIFVASDTGDIYYDADGDFAAGAEIIGSITTAEVASLTADNFIIA